LSTSSTSPSEEKLNTRAEDFGDVFHFANGTKVFQTYTTSHAARAIAHIHDCKIEDGRNVGKGLKNLDRSRSDLNELRIALMGAHEDATTVQVDQGHSCYSELPSASIAYRIRRQGRSAGRRFVSRRQRLWLLLVNKHTIELFVCILLIFEFGCTRRTFPIESSRLMTVRLVRPSKLICAWFRISIVMYLRVGSMLHRSPSCASLAALSDKSLKLFSVRSCLFAASHERVKYMYRSVPTNSMMTLPVSSSALRKFSFSACRTLLGLLRASATIAMTPSLLLISAPRLLTNNAERQTSLAHNSKHSR
ncbi:hypothetical protein KCU77_g93, partial [Aureobasidium melanogenum]